MAFRHKKRKKLWMAAAAAAVCLFAAVSPATVKAQSQWDAVETTDWMANIDGNKRITEINMPGTHDSGTKGTNSFSECQNTTLTQQMENGVRFLDIRLEAQSDGKLYLVHASVDCKSPTDGGKFYFEEALQECYEFLDAHPTETVVMSVKKDDGDDADAKIQQYVHSYIDQNPDYWYLQNGKPFLNDTRGKIVLLSRYKNENNYDDKKRGLHFVWSDQGGSSAVDPPWAKVQVTGLTGAWVQDRYEYSETDKWEAVQRGLDSPPDENNRANTYFLNFLSAAWKILNMPTSPSSNASKINKRFSDYEMTQGKAYGWIIMDFATKELAQKVIASNNYTEIPEKVQIAKTKEALNIAPTVSSDLKLPLTGTQAGAGEGTSIAWTSGNNEALKTYGSESWLVCPSHEKGDASLTLTATITSGRYSDTKTFDVTVSCLDGVSFKSLRLAIQAAKQVYSDALGAGLYAEASLEELNGAIQAAEAFAAKENTDDSVTDAQVKGAEATLAAAMERELRLKSRKELDKNLIAWYALSENGNDASGRGNHATAKGVAFTREDGATMQGAGKKLQSYLSLPAAMFNGKDKLTVSFWAKDSGTAGDRNQAVFSFGSGTDSNPGSSNVFRYLLINTNKNGKLKVVVSNNSWSGEKGFSPADAAYPKNTWAHITCVMEGANLTLYKDGQLVGTMDTGVKLTDFGANRVAYIGNSLWSGSDEDYIGSVKDFRVYDVPLKAEQVAEVYRYLEEELPAEYVRQDILEAISESLGQDAAPQEDGSFAVEVTKESMTLPKAGYKDAAIVWESSKPGVIDEDGNVTLPEDVSVDEQVTLTAKITLATGETAEVVFHCTVYRKLAVDTQELEALVALAEQKKQDDYTQESWEAFALALQEAKRQIARPTGASAVQEAMADLQAKMDALNKLGDKTELNRLIDSVKTLQESAYVSVSWQELQAALRAAEQTAQDAQATQEAVDEACRELLEKKEALVKRGDKESLGLWIQKAQELTEEDYTAESWQELVQVLEQADAVFKDADADQDEVDRAKEAVETAVDQLVKISVTVTFDPANGGETVKVSVRKGEKVQQPAQPQKEGYDFAGWYEAGAQSAFDFDTAVTGDLTLTAKWTQKQNPGGNEPGGDNPGGSNPGGDNPGGSNPGGDNPGGSNPGGSNPGGQNPSPGRPVSIASAKVTVAKAQYNGKAQKPKVTVVSNNKVLKQNLDYTVAYQNNKKIGNAKAVITGIGTYTGTVEKSFQIQPKKVKITKITNKTGRKLTVKFQKSKGAKGYEISCATSKKFKSAKKVKTGKSTATLTKLKKGKTYYVRVRPYAKAGKKTIYGDYSSVVKKKVAK